MNLFRFLLVWMIMASLTPFTHAAQTWPVPDGAPETETFDVRVDGNTSGVYATTGCDFTSFTLGEKPAQIDISLKQDAAPKSVVVRPLSQKIEAKIEKGVVRFTIDKPMQLSVEIDGQIPLLVFADPKIELDPKQPDAEVVRVTRYEAGYHDMGGEPIRLRSNVRLIIEGGAYLGNCEGVYIRNAQNVSVLGSGVIAGHTRVMESSNVRFAGVVINPQKRSWMNKIDVSRNVRFEWTKSICGLTNVPNFDGFDIMSGCRNIRIEDSFVRGTDDCLTIKHHPSSPGYWQSKSPVSDVEMNRCVLWNLRAGTIFRIGPETIGSSISDITMRDIDVIHASRGFEILPVDGVEISNIVFDDIRIENYEKGLVEFEWRRWYKVGPRNRKGRVRDVYLRNWNITGGIRDWKIENAEGEETFANIYVDGMVVDGKPIEGDANNRSWFLPGTIVGSDAKMNVVDRGEAFAEKLLDESYFSNGEQPTQHSSQAHKPLRLDAAQLFTHVQGDNSWYYEQFNPEPVQVYNNRKDIVQPPCYVLMDWDIIEANEQWIAHDDATRITKTKMHAGATYHAVRTAVALINGRANIAGMVTGSGRVRIVYNEKATPLPKDDAVVWDWQDVPETGELSHDVTIDVKQGGVIRFILENGEVEWSPSVEYVGAK